MAAHASPLAALIAALWLPPSHIPAPKHTCVRPFTPHMRSLPAALNLAYSQHEIVSDYVRPTLIWLERGGKGATLNNLVKRFDLYGRISCLNERTEGCRK